LHKNSAADGFSREYCKGNQTVLTEAVSNFAVRCLDLTGYFGAGLLMALESMIAPIPSEAVMPFVGFLVADGSWNLWVAIGVTSLGSIVGSLISYAMGYYGGKPVVLRVGRYLLLNPHDLIITERFFHRRGGILTVFISRFIPVVRHLISITTGIGRMPLIPFLAATLIGATLWNTFLLLCGMKLREHWPVVQQYSHHIDLVVGVVLLAGLAWFLKSRFSATQRREEKNETQQ
jgi:membrane protein DedA with SNARE-associated domain